MTSQIANDHHTSSLMKIKNIEDNNYYVTCKFNDLLITTYDYDL